MMEFYKKRYRNLLKYSEKIKQEKKNLFDISESDYLELLSYSAKTFLRLELECSNFYLNLIEQFLDGQICEAALFSKYLELQNWQEKIQNSLESNLIILSPHPTADSVYDLLDKLYWTLEDMSVETEEQFFQAVIQEENYDEAIATIKAAEISTSIKEIYLQLQNIVKNYRSDSKVSTNLSQLVDQLNWENQDLYIELIDEFLNDSSNFLNFKERYMVY